MLISPPSRARLKQAVTEKLFFGNEPSPELIAIVLVYFVQGVLGLARLAVSFFLKDELALGPAEVSTLMGLAFLPWTIKPLYGFLSDGLPIFGYRRRPYIVSSGILGALSWVGMATVVDSAWKATAAMLVSSLAIAVSDVIVDALVVERARNESQSKVGSLQSLCWASRAVGGVITAYFSGLLLEQFNPQTVFLITASFPLMVSVVAWLVAEERVSDRPNLSTVKEQIKKLKWAITQKSILLPTAFIFIWQATPTADSVFFFFTTNELGFQPEFLGRVQLVTSIAGFIGVWLFQRFFKTIPFRTIFGWFTVISAVLGMTTLILVTHANRIIGIDDHWFSLGDSLVLTVMGQLAYMPLLVLAARLCPPGIEATLFALVLSVNNLATLLSYQFGALLMHGLGITESNFEHLWLLVVITNLSTLLPLPFLHLLPANHSQIHEEVAVPESLLSLSTQVTQPVEA